MPPRKEQGLFSDAPANGGATFELERFAWGAPDRLELSGTFVGLPDAPLDAPVLVLSGPEGTHRLPAVPDALSEPPAEGQLWFAEFAWQEPPVAFDDAAVELGADLVIELPQPRTKSFRFRKQALAVRKGEGEAEAEPARNEHGGAERLRLESELLMAQQEMRELRAAEEETRAELDRTRDDLESVRARHAADARRFREGLAKVQESANEALSAERRAADELDAALREAREALEAKDAALSEARSELDAAEAARAQVEKDARKEAEIWRRRIAALESAGSAAEEARADAEQLLSRLTALRDALGDGR